MVFVDDLDRCLPEKAIQVLEALKLFLDVEGCIFVLGLDPEAIAAAVQQRYRGEVKANEYLEKIIQLPFNLPLIADNRMQSYVEALTARNLERRAPRCLRWPGRQPPPRKVKRTLNTFLLMSRLVDKRLELKETLTPVRLAKLVAIQQAYPDLYAEVLRRPGADPTGGVCTCDTRRRQAHGGGALAARRVEAVCGRGSLRRLFCLQEDAAACFGGLKMDELRGS